MFELDPASPTTNITGSISASAVPGLGDDHPARAFGYVPNLKRLLPGDLILTSDRSLASWAVRWRQRRDSADNAHWTHAAVYVGNGLIVEALPVTNVWQAPLVSFVPTRKLLFRRLRQIIQSTPSEALFKGQSIALDSALQISAQRYALFGVIRMAQRSGWLEPLYSLVPPTRSAGVICSGLYADSVYRTTGVTLTAPEDVIYKRPIFPAELAATPEMQSIEVGWARIT
jgi:cell wall-associated NlpC family hydrolase